VIAVVISYFRYLREGDFDEFTVRTFDLNAWSREGLGRLQTFNNPADSLTINRDDFDVVFAVQRLKRGKGLSNFHVPDLRILTKLRTVG
jgi:hypothetical protein